MSDLRSKMSNSFPAKDAGSRVIIAGKSISKDIAKLFSIFDDVKESITGDAFSDVSDVLEALNNDPSVLAKVGIELMVIPDTKGLPNVYVPVSKSEVSRYLNTKTFHDFPGHVMWAVDKSLKNKDKTLFDIVLFLSIMGHFYINIEGFSKIDNDDAEKKLISKAIQKVFLRRLDQFEIII
jgi:hypothetical protein